MKMYRDQEVDMLYLGKPLDFGPAEVEDEVVELPSYTDEEVECLFLGLPLKAA